MLLTTTSSRSTLRNSGRLDDLGSDSKVRCLASSAWYFPTRFNAILGLAVNVSLLADLFLISSTEQSTTETDHEMGGLHAEHSGSVSEAP